MTPLERLKLLGAIVASGVLVASPDAGADRRDVRILPLARAGAVDLVMTGGAPRTRLAIAVPHGWERAAIRVDLRWRASPLLSEHSLIRVDVDGVPRATSRIGPGMGRLPVHAPVRRVTGHQIIVEIGAVLATADDDCPPPDAPGAYLRLDAGSMLIISGIRSSRRPALGDVPEALVERVGDVVPPLRIRLPPRPSAEHVQAAGLVAGAVSSITGFPGTPVGVTTERSGVDGATLRIRDGHQPGVAVGRRPDGRIVLDVSGSGPQLVQAAWSIAAGRTAALRDATAGVTERVPRASPAKFAGGARLTPVEATGTGRSSLRLPFRVGESEVAYEPARLELLLGLDAPAGGRIAVAVNGRPLGGRSLAPTGTGRLRLTYPLHRGDLRAGDNTVDLHVELATAAAGRCAPLSNAPRLVVLGGSRLTWKPGPRPLEASLALWPFPASTQPRWSAATVVMPADPRAAELEAVVETLAEGARWGGGAVLPRVVLGDADLAEDRDRHLLVLVRDLRVPRGVPAPPERTPGLLTARRVGDRVVALAFGPDALRPLGHGYFLGRVPARAALVGRHGDIRILEPHQVEPLPLQSSPVRGRWVMLAVLAFGIGLFVWLFARAARRMRSLRSPTVVDEAQHLDSVLEKEVVGVRDFEPQAKRTSTGEAAVAAWRRLATEEEANEKHERP